MRRIVGIAGAPGAGKSTLAARLVAGRPERILVPMDGFHLRQAELVRLGRADRKGAPDTFDVDGYVALLRHLRTAPDSIITAPRFDRHLEEPVDDAVVVEPRHTLIVTEGNYLLHDAGGWEAVRPLLDECWFVDDQPGRQARLVDRHVEHGRTREAADAWVRDVDEPNARLVEATRHRADRIVAFDELPDL